MRGDKLTRVEALKSLKPNSEWTWDWDGETDIRDYDKLTWLSSDTKPTESEIDTELSRLKADQSISVLREMRNILLEETDWTQCRDVTLSNDADWKTYRQALRDLPSSSSPKLLDEGGLDPTSVTWPTKPS